MPTLRRLTVSSIKPFFRYLSRTRIKGAALSEYIPLVLAVGIASIVAFQRVGNTLQDQGGNIVAELGGQESAPLALGDIGPLSSPSLGAPSRPVSSSGSNSGGGGNQGGSAGSSSGGGAASGGTGSGGSNNGGTGGGQSGAGGSNPTDPFGGGGNNDGGGQFCSAPGGNAPAFRFVGNPIDLATGNKFQQEDDYRGVSRATKGFWGIQWSRYYNSIQATNFTGIGQGWRHHYQRSVVVDETGEYATLLRHDGSRARFELHKGQWISKDYNIHKLASVYQTNGDLKGYQYQRADGTTEYYNAQGKLLRLQHFTGAAQVLSYNEEGQLDRIEDTAGLALELYYQSKQLIAVKGPDGFHISYNYDDRLNLASVSFSLRSWHDAFTDSNRSSTKHYEYNDPRYPNALTAIIDESKARYASWTYDDQQRAISSQHGDAVEKVTVEYLDNNKVSVTNTSGKVSTYHFVEAGGQKRTAYIDGDATHFCAASQQQHIYADNGFLKTTIDAEGNATIYQRNKRGLITSERRGYYQQGQDFIASDNATRVDIKWHPDFPLPTTITYYSWQHGQWQDTLNQTTTYTAQGRVETQTYTDLSDQTLPYSTHGHSRSYRYHYRYYDEAKSLLAEASVNGPRPASHNHDDITSYHYDRLGNLTRVINALGHETQYTQHNAQGLPQVTRDANGAETRLEYNHRGWLTQSVRDVQGQPATTVFSYYDNGLLKQTTLADGSHYRFRYSTGRQLTQIENHRGEKILIKPNALNGQWSHLSIVDNQGNTIRQQQRLFDELGRIVAFIGNYGQQTELNYDRNNNAITLTQQTGNDKNKLSSQRYFDQLNRLLKATNAAGGETHYSYAPQGKVATVTAANGAVTHYVYNGFGDIIQTNSPDTGVVVKYYDQAGNPIRSQRHFSVDAKAHSGVTSHYDYLNRLVKIESPDSRHNIEYIYDQHDINHGFGLGRLTHIKEAGTTIDYRYDKWGNILEDKRKIIIDGQAHNYTTAYSYSPAGKLASITYPSGEHISYQYDKEQLRQISRLDSVSNNDKKVVKKNILVDNIRYLPFGQEQSWRYGNYLNQKHSYDQDGRLSSIQLKNSKDTLWERQYSFDAFNNIVNIHQSFQQEDTTQSFAYDAMGHVIREANHETIQSYQYDSVGNRLTHSQTHATDNIKTNLDYHYHPDTNRLKLTGMFDIKQDIAGNLLAKITDKSQEQFIYNHQNRLSEYYVNGEQRANYGYNSLGQRTYKQVKKANHNDEQVYTVFHYHLNGQLLGETHHNKTGIEHINYVWFDKRPISQISTTIENGTNRTESSITYIHTDHLKTPRLATNNKQQSVWEWQSDAFGVGQENSDFDGDGIHTSISLRFPGQYADEESGLFYNYYRSYDPQMGRYTQSDPIGLQGGMNTYAYVLSNPIAFTDSLGLDVEILIGGPYASASYGHVALRVFGEGYDYVYDYGRYGSTWGIGGSEGEGQLRVWTDFNRYIAGENATGRTTHGYVYSNSSEQDQQIIDYYNGLIENVDPNGTRGDYMNQYRIADYHAANNNCTTVALDGLEAGVPSALHDAINNADYNEGLGLSFTQRVAFWAAYNGDGVSLPLDLQQSIIAQDGYTTGNTYSSQGNTSEPNND